MLTAAVASTDSASSSQLRACLQQSGLVMSVKEWTISTGKFPELTETVPDVVLLDLSRDPEPYFALAAHLRRLRPSVRLIACSPVSEPNPQLLLEAMRCGVQDLLTKPIDLAALKQTLALSLQETRPGDKRAAERLIVVMGSKGGVGATTVTVNLGAQMTQLPKKRVVVLDLARPLGMVHLMLDLRPRFGVRDAVENLDRLDGHFFGGLLTHHKSGLEVLAGALQPEEWQRIPVSSLERVINVAQGSFDSVLVDFGSQFSSDWSPSLQLARLILLVAETNVPALWALERRLLALAGFGVDPERIRIVINRWRRGDEAALKTVEKNIKRPLFAYLPNDYRRVSEAINMGAPLQGLQSNGLAAKYTQLAAQLAGIDPRVTEVKRSGFPHFFLKR